MKAMFGFGAVLAFAAGCPAQAHEMFLEPAQNRLDPGARTTITLNNGVFGRSENEVSRDRMASVVVMTDGKQVSQAESQWHDANKTSFLDIAVGEAGTYVIGVSTKPNVIALAAADFDRYLRDERITNIAAERAAAPPSQPTVRERYSKHVRAIVQVGSKLTADMGMPLGFPAEILLMQNPSTLKVGYDLTFRATYRGGPMAGQTVTASYEGFAGSGAGGAAVAVVTDADGKATFRIPKAGRWYINLINMRPVTGDVDYESNWSTVTFEVAGPSGR